MSESLILIRGKKFLMDKIRIKSLLTNLLLTEEG